ncbi:MAG: hypothetical protein RQ722_02970 [Desulfuromonadales bacterium]|nr:hypothetical protein [Desulfuromonadales bacterium]
MLIYESEGFLEVESKHIKQLCRSTVSIPFGDIEREVYAVHASLCDHIDKSGQHCRVAFYTKSLKRSLVFTVKGPEKQSPWQHGQEILAQLGFQLEDVDLKLSPAMLEVVLRNVPGLLSPDEAHKERNNKKQLLAELQESCDTAPGSTQGQKAALKLSAEMRLRGYAEELRLLLERSLANADIEVLANQVKILTSSLEAVQTLADAENKQRLMSESITSAAEKRIQELEKLLVDVETKSSDTLKQKRKIEQLQRRIKKLDETLASAEAEATKKSEKQEQLVAEARVSREHVAALEKQLEESKVSLENTQAELVVVQQTLKESLVTNSALRKTLATEIEQNAGLRFKLRETEDLIKIRDEEQVATLREQRVQFARELKDLRAEYDQECSIRKRLEKKTVEDGQRIDGLEDALVKATEKASELSVGEKEFSSVARGEIESLKIKLQEQQQRVNEERKSREDLESAIDEAHKFIDSLEKKVRESESTAKEQLSREVSGRDESQKICELELRLKMAESQLEQERVEQQRLLRAIAVAENKIAEQKERLVRGQAGLVEKESLAVVAEASARMQTKSAKPLPHELRPEPKKGVYFRPDWDLGGLPCRSSEQVFEAWESVFNVQTSLEGYPSQYCMAFLVVLRLEKQKKLYLLYRLKQSKHTLVCVPAKTPKDEPSFKKATNEGLDFLRRSGFDMEAMSTEDIDSSLRTYFGEG